MRFTVPQPIPRDRNSRSGRLEINSDGPRRRARRNGRRRERASPRRSGPSTSPAIGSGTSTRSSPANTVMIARAPGVNWPRSSRPTQRAPPSVASRKRVGRRKRVGSHRRAGARCTAPVASRRTGAPLRSMPRRRRRGPRRCRRPVRSVTRHMPAAEPRVRRRTVRDAGAGGAEPLPLRRRRSGCRAQPRRRARSSPTRRAAPSDGVPKRAMQSTCSSSVSARCVCRRSPCGAGQVRRRLHQLRRHRERRARRDDDGDHLAVVMAGDDRLGRREDRRRASSTTWSGGRPPSFCERSIEPRDRNRRTPTSRAASTIASNTRVVAARHEVVMVEHARAAARRELARCRPAPRRARLRLRAGPTPGRAS